MGNINFGERMRRARVRNAWTGVDLARKLDVSQATISNWETGKSSPSTSQKATLKRILGLNRDEKKSDTEDADADGQGPFSGWLNRMMVEKGLSVAELVDTSGLSAPGIYNILNGRIANPRASTVKRLEKALGAELPSEAKQEIRAEATIKDVGELLEIEDPQDDDELPAVAGVYVFYDISERPVYVGQASNIKARIRTHRDEKFWFRKPIVQTCAYVQIDDEDLRRKVETLLIRFLKSNAVLNKQNVER